MIRNYFLVSIRALMRNLFFFGINTIGLAVGIAACLLCYLHIRYELSYDQHFPKSDRIYRFVTGDVPGGDGWVKVSAPIPPLVKENVPELDDYARFTKVTYDPKITVGYEEKVFNEADFFMADPSFLEIFDVAMISGSRTTALADKSSVVISASSARKYFGEEDPVGKVITLNEKFDFAVTGVFEDVPHHSHFDYDFLISFQNLETIFPGTRLDGNWGQFNYFAYALLHEGADPSAAEQKMRSVSIEISEENEFTLEDLAFQPLSDVHFQDNRGNLKVAYDKKYLFIYVAVALAILTVSIINFVNLSIAGSTKRVREVGLRKVVGASRTQIMGQFITESFLISILAMGIAVLLMEQLLLPATNDILDSRISISYTQSGFIIPAAGITLLIAISSGSYIAFFVTSFQPIESIKGAFKIGTRGATFKNILLGIQFTISIMLIISSIFIYRQLIYMKNKDLGLEPGQVLNVALYNQEAREQAELLKSEIGKFSWAEHVSGTRFVPGGANWNNSVWWEGQEENESMFLIMIDEKTIETLDMELLEGDIEAIKKPVTDNEVRYILNESALNTIGWESAVGKAFTAFGQDRIKPISGVVKDFNFRSLHHNVAPCVLVVSSWTLPSQLFVKLSTTDYSSAVASTEEVFRNLVPSTPFEYSFLDSQFDRLYKSEDRTARIVAFLTIVAIVLALLGLYGLMTFVVQERTREMAIRKVLGVSPHQIPGLLSRDFLKLLIAANIISIPVVWLVLNNWLQNFNYRVSLDVLTFVWSSALIWIFVLLTISVNVVQVLRIDPVRGLKYE